MLVIHVFLQRSSWHKVVQILYHGAMKIDIGITARHILRMILRAIKTIPLVFTLHLAIESSFGRVLYIKWKQWNRFKSNFNIRFIEYYFHLTNMHIAYRRELRLQSHTINTIFWMNLVQFHYFINFHSMGYVLHG